MGLGRTLLLGDIGNLMDIEDNQDAVFDLEHDVRALGQALESSINTNVKQDDYIISLYNENKELKLYLAALIRLLTAKGVLTRDELGAMVHAVDAEDGTTDGKYDGSIG